MKTNKFSKCIIALMAVVIFSTLAVPVFADTGNDPSSYVYAFKKDKKEHSKRDNHRHEEWLEDWFEDRIDAREHSVDYSKLPDNPSDEDFYQFFKKNFVSEIESPKNGHQPGRSMKDEQKADRFEDWFEDRIDIRKGCADFSELPEKPTDEEILEFFKKNFMDQNGRLIDGEKQSPDAPANPDIEPAPVTDPAPQSDSVPEPEETLPEPEQPSEEGKDKA